MLKKILAFIVMFYAALAFAAVDVNQASAAELDGIKGIGPAISGKILDERKKGNFKDWNDLIGRVKGVGEVNAAKFSTQGLTVGGATFKNSAATPAAKAADAKPAAAAAPAAAEKKDPKAETAMKASEAKAKKAADKKAKADPAKPAASAAKK